jgi:hypothetical protein
MNISLYYIITIVLPDYNILFKAIVQIDKLSQFIKRVSYISHSEFRLYLNDMIQYIYGHAQ